MKNIKTLGIIAMVAIITFAMIACGGGGGPSGDPNTGDPNTGDPNTGDPNTGDPNDGGKPFLVELNPSSITFPPAVQGYDTQSTIAVTVKNTGTDYTGNLSVTIVKDDGFPSTDFVSPATSTPVASIAPNANGSFNIRPADGLSAGGYAATVNVFNGNGDIHESIEVSFSVRPIGFSFDKTYTSIADFKTFLGCLPDNTADTPYPIKVSISDLGGAVNTAGSLGYALNTNDTKYVSLDMSGSSFTTMPFNGLPSNKLTSIVIPASVTSIAENNLMGWYMTSVTFLRADTDISASGFLGRSSLQTAYANGGAGTYTTIKDGDQVAQNAVWTKQ